MNIFSNIGITELIVILLLALLVIGPERLPEFGRKLGKALRDFRRAYDRLTRDLGPELSSIQKTTREFRESVDAVRSIPQDAVRSVVQAADLEDTVTDLKEAAGGMAEAKAALVSAERVIRSPVKSVLASAENSLLPPASLPASDGDATETTAEGPPHTEAEAGEDADG